MLALVQQVCYLDLGLSRLSTSADDFAEEVADLRAIFRASQQSDMTGWHMRAGVRGSHLPAASLMAEFG